VPSFNQAKNFLQETLDIKAELCYTIDSDLIRNLYSIVISNNLVV